MSKKTLLIISFIFATILSVLFLYYQTNTVIDRQTQRVQYQVMVQDSVIYERELQEPVVSSREVERRSSEIESDSIDIKGTNVSPVQPIPEEFVPSIQSQQVAFWVDIIVSLLGGIAPFVVPMLIWKYKKKEN